MVCRRRNLCIWQYACQDQCAVDELHISTFLAKLANTLVLKGFSCNQRQKIRQCACPFGRYRIHSGKFIDIDRNASVLNSLLRYCTFQRCLTAFQLPSVALLLEEKQHRGRGLSCAQLWRKTGSAQLSQFNPSDRTAKLNGGISLHGKVGRRRLHSWASNFYSFFWLTCVYLNVAGFVTRLLFAVPVDPHANAVCTRAFPTPFSRSSHCGHG